MVESKRYTKRRILRKRQKTKRQKTKRRRILRKRQGTKRLQRGGLMTVSADTNPLGYREDDYDQNKNMLNYDPSTF